MDIAQILYGGKKKTRNVRKAMILLLAFLFLALPSLTACAGTAAETTSAAGDNSGKQWDTTVPTALTDDVQELLRKATSEMDDKEYIPVAVLGTLDGTYCILCKETDSSNTAPKNVLVYVNADGIQNTYEIWIDKHGSNGD